jgi:ArsR family transcriptional regulator
MDEQNPDEIDVLRALAHPVRWGILQRLAAEPGICACDFTEFFDVSQPTISVHLKVLREAGGRHRRRRAAALTSARGADAVVAGAQCEPQPSIPENLVHARRRGCAVGPCLKASGVSAFGDPGANVLRNVEAACGHNPEQ